MQTLLGEQKILLLFLNHLSPISEQKENYPVLEKLEKTIKTSEKM